MWWFVPHLFAPWRMVYIGTGSSSECIFCTMPAEKNDVENLLIHRGSTCFVMMNRFPYNPGHLMVAPYRHVGGYDDLVALDRAGGLDALLAAS